jgi:hypothetical protein
LQDLAFIRSDRASVAGTQGRAARAGDRRRRPVPAAVLGAASVPPQPDITDPLAHPLDTPGFSIARRDEPLPRRAYAVSAAGRRCEPLDDGSRTQDAPRRFTPVPFSASLNTSESFDG